jgi:hypothetical protein
MNRAILVINGVGFDRAVPVLHEGHHAPAHYTSVTKMCPLDIIRITGDCYRYSRMLSRAIPERSRRRVGERTLMPQEIDLAFDFWRRSRDETKAQWPANDMDQARRQCPHEIACRDYRCSGDEGRDDHRYFTADAQLRITAGQIAMSVTRSNLHIDVSEVCELRFRDRVAGQSMTSTGDEDTFFMAQRDRMDAGRSVPHADDREQTFRLVDIVANYE